MYLEKFNFELIKYGKWDSLPDYFAPKLNRLRGYTVPLWIVSFSGLQGRETTGGNERIDGEFKQMEEIGAWRQSATKKDTKMNPINLNCHSNLVHIQMFLLIFNPLNWKKLSPSIISFPGAKKCETNGGNETIKSRKYFIFFS